MMILRLSLVKLILVVALVAVFFPTGAKAAGGSIEYVTINDRPLEDFRGRDGLFPDQPVEICFEGNYYTYLSSSFEEVAVHFWWEDQRGKVADFVLETIDVIDPNQIVEDGGAMMPISRCFRWRAPAEEGRYALFSHRLPIVKEPSAFRSESSRAALARENREDQWGSVELGAVEVSEFARPSPIPYSVILKIDGRTPGATETIKGGVTDEPLEVDWIVRKTSGQQDVEVQAQYLLYPGEEWSPWTSATSASFDFILRGQHEFRLRTRYRKPGEAWAIVPSVSKIAFTIDDTLISKVSSKGLDRVDGTGALVQPSWIDEELYGRSRAFLAGVQFYENDEDFPPLPYIDNDLDQVSAALQSVGFTDIADPILNGDRATILDRLQNFIEATQEGDRLVLYFSMHGFESGTDRQNPYLATRDCDPSPIRAKTNCLALSDLKELVSYAVSPDGKKAQHVLVVLDACSVGMGIVRKSAGTDVRFVEQSIAEIPGAHVMTAGLAGQAAFVDNSARISFFTRALVDGLKGEADVYKDQVITLSELEVYVRRQVALATESKQTPMVGDIVGAGQIVFRSPVSAVE